MKCILFVLFVFRMVVELHRKVSSLIEYLKQKWTYHDQRIVSFETHTGALKIDIDGASATNARIGERTVNHRTYGGSSVCWAFP